MKTLLFLLFFASTAFAGEAIEITFPNGSNVTVITGEGEPPKDGAVLYPNGKTVVITIKGKNEEPTD